jgi:hypothetical protein
MASMRSFLLSLVATGAVFASSTARADQCALNSPPVAATAAKLVKQGATVLDYCEPCGDRAPGKPYTVNTVGLARGELVVNGADVDLAYLFLQTAPGEFRNVGIMTMCGAEDVSEWIRGGKPSGPVARTPSRARPPIPPPPPRASGPDDLAGLWNVRITTKYSSCPGVRAGSEQTTWRITTNGGVLELESADGAMLGGPVEIQPRSTLKATLRPKLHPSGTVLSLSMFFKDQLHGTLVRAKVLAGTARDPVCVVQQELSARR